MSEPKIERTKTVCKCSICKGKSNLVLNGVITCGRCIREQGHEKALAAFFLQVDLKPKPETKERDLVAEPKIERTEKMHKCGSCDCRSGLMLNGVTTCSGCIREQGYEDALDSFIQDENRRHKKEEDPGPKIERIKKMRGCCFCKDQSNLVLNGVITCGRCIREQGHVKALAAFIQTEVKTKEGDPGPKIERTEEMHECVSCNRQSSLMLNGVTTCSGCIQIAGYEDALDSFVQDENRRYKREQSESKIWGTDEKSYEKALTVFFQARAESRAKEENLTAEPKIERAKETYECISCSHYTLMKLNGVSTCTRCIREQGYEKALVAFYRTEAEAKAKDESEAKTKEGDLTAKPKIERTEEMHECVSCNRQSSLMLNGVTACAFCIDKQGYEDALFAFFLAEVEAEVKEGDSMSEPKIWRTKEKHKCISCDLQTSLTLNGVTTCANCIRAAGHKDALVAFIRDEDRRWAEEEISELMGEEPDEHLVHVSVIRHGERCHICERPATVAINNQPTCGHCITEMGRHVQDEVERVVPSERITTALDRDDWIYCPRVYDPNEDVLVDKCDRSLGVWLTAKGPVKFDTFCPSVVCVDVRVGACRLIVGYLDAVPGILNPRYRVYGDTEDIEPMTMRRATARALELWAEKIALVEGRRDRASE